MSREVAARELPGAFRTVRGALDLADDRSSSVVIDLNEITIEHLLLQLDDPGRLRDFASSVLGRAVDYNRTRSTELLHTARCSSTTVWIAAPLLLRCICTPTRSRSGSAGSKS